MSPGSHREPDGDVIGSRPGRIIAVFVSANLNPANSHDLLVGGVANMVFGEQITELYHRWVALMRAVCQDFPCGMIEVGGAP